MSTNFEVGDTVVFNGYSSKQKRTISYPSQNPALQKGMFGVIAQILDRVGPPVVRVSWDTSISRGYENAEYVNCWAVLESEVTKSRAGPKVDKIIKKVNAMYERQPYYKKVLLGEQHV